MIDGFTKDIIRMTQEARDLKTAHLHGLGSTLFYQYRVVVDGLTPGYVKNIALTASVVDGWAFPPLFTVSALTPPGASDEGVYNCEINFDSKINCDLTIASTSDQLTLMLKSSSRLEDINWEAA